MIVKNHREAYYNIIIIWEKKKNKQILFVKVGDIGINVKLLLAFVWGKYGYRRVNIE